MTSLCGVDIDPRCAQVASAVLVLRARRHCRDLPLPRPNIVTARGLPGGSASLLADVVLTPEQHQLVDRIGDVLADAPLLGVLLKAEVALEHEVRHAAFGGVPGTLPMSEDHFEKAEADLMAHLQDVADRASSSVAERLLAAEADDALRLLEIVRRRYDVVLMNPPFGEPVGATKPYLRTAYPWIPTRDYNLLAAFVGRGIELCKADGYLGAITSRAGFFLTTFERWRADVVLSRLLVTFLDLGSDVMEGAMVEAAAYVIGARPSDEKDVGLFIRMLKERDRPAGIQHATAALRRGHEPDEVVRVPMSEIQMSPAGVFAYWDPSGMRPNLVGLPRMEMNNPRMQPRVGLQSSDDARFVRVWWEVAARRCGVSRADTQNGRRWVPLAKGGDYSPYYSDFELIVNWEDNGRAVRSFEKAKVQNEQHYFCPGLTWPERTVSAFAPQICPPGVIPSVVGPLCRIDDPKLRLVALAWLNSRPARWVIESSAPAGEETKTGGTAARHYTVGGVQRMPWIGTRLDEDTTLAISDLTSELVDLRASLDETDETTRRFIVPGALRHHDGSVRDRALAGVTETEDAALTILEHQRELDRRFLAALDAQPTQDLDGAVGPQVAALPRAPLVDAEVNEFCSLYARPLNEVIEAATVTVGMARHVRLSYHVVDRRLETLAIAFSRHPQVLTAVRRDHRLLPPQEPQRTAEDLLSYLVGAAFGRWDVRIGRDPSLAPPPTDPFDLLPICPPAMLAGADGFPDSEIPAGYPVAVPGERLMVDEPGHVWDISAAAAGAAKAVADDPETLLSESLEIVGRKTLRDYVRKQFFKDHLSRYSKSRRKAPIYWQLSVPSRNWGVWVYAPALSREMLYALAREAARRERLGLEAITRLQGEQTGPGISSRKVAAELDAEEKLGEELRRFREEAERIAALGWKPDLDDGLVLCAAPLADLFPAWPDAKKTREELREGQYEWASVAQWSGEL